MTSPAQNGPTRAHVSVVSATSPHAPLPLQTWMSAMHTADMAMLYGFCDVSRMPYILNGVPVIRAL